MIRCRSRAGRSALRRLAVAATAAVLAILVLPGTAGATTARVLALGGQGGYLEDQSNVLAWYGSLVDYPDLVVLDLGDSERVPEHGAGFHGRLDRRQRWGTLAAYLQGDTDEPRRDSASLLWARPFGSVDGALVYQNAGFERDSGYDDDADQLHRDWRYLLGAGLRWQAADRLYGDLAGEIVGTDFAYRDLNSYLVEDTTWDTFGLRARLFWGPSDRVALVPLYEHLEDRRGAYSPELVDAAHLRRNVNRLGLGLNLLPDPDHLIVVSVEYEDGGLGVDGTGGSAAVADGYRRDWRLLRGRVGLEARVLPWLSVRGAARYVRLDDDASEHWPAREELPAGETTSFDDGVDTEVNLDLGLGLHLGRFEADFVFDEGAVRNLGGLVTNTESGSRAQFTAVSFLYSF